MLESFAKVQLFKYLFKDKNTGLTDKEMAHISFAYDGDFKPMCIELMMKQKRNQEEYKALKHFKNSIFFEMKVPLALEDRYLWLNYALTFANKVQIIELSPQKGLALKGFNQDYKSSAYPQKILFLDELRYFYRLPYLEVCICHQDLENYANHQEEISMTRKQLEKEYDYILSIREKAHLPRVYFFLCKSEVIYECLKHNLEVFKQSAKDLWV
jgi:hypothetical protein